MTQTPDIPDGHPSAASEMWSGIDTDHDSFYTDHDIADDSHACTHAADSVSIEPFHDDALYENYTPQTAEIMPMDATLEDLQPVYGIPEFDQSDARIAPPSHHSTSSPDDQAYHRPRTHYQHGQPIQINNPNMNAAPQSPGPSIGDTMQMMMMNQMMTQQMTAQQMQAAQMNMLMKQAGGRGRGFLREKKAGVKITSRQVRRHQPRPVQLVMPPQGVQPPQAPALGGVESAAMANWQEATIILCFAIVGLIYLVSSRSTAKEDDEKSAVARHLTTKAR